MTNPFDVPDANYSVLRNDENQYSLWPAFADVPDGWTVEHGPGRREDCLTYVTEHWTDLRPRSVVEHVTAQRPDH
jgi:MbtH protein